RGRDLLVQFVWVERSPVHHAEGAGPPRPCLCECMQFVWVGRSPANHTEGAGPPCAVCVGGETTCQSHRGGGTSSSCLCGWRDHLSLTQRGRDLLIIFFVDAVCVGGEITCQSHRGRGTFLVQFVGWRDHLSITQGAGPPRAVCVGGEITCHHAEGGTSSCSLCGWRDHLSITQRGRDLLVQFVWVERSPVHHAEGRDLLVQFVWVERSPVNHTEGAGPPRAVCVSGEITCQSHRGGGTSSCSLCGWRDHLSITQRARDLLVQFVWVERSPVHHAEGAGPPRAVCVSGEITCPSRRGGGTSC
ncbi:Rho GTPase-activating protein 21, partial [Dissostichus eleginoides]